MSLPQILMTLILALAIGNAARDHGKTRPVNLLDTMIHVSTLLALLFWGGFFHG